MAPKCQNHPEVTNSLPDSFANRRASDQRAGNSKLDLKLSHQINQFGCTEEEEGGGGGKVEEFTDVPTTTTVTTTSLTLTTLTTVTVTTATVTTATVPITTVTTTTFVTKSGQTLGTTRLTTATLTTITTTFTSTSSTTSTSSSSTSTSSTTTLPPKYLTKLNVSGYNCSKNISLRSVLVPNPDNFQDDFQCYSWDAEANMTLECEGDGGDDCLIKVSDADKEFVKYDGKWKKRLEKCERYRVTILVTSDTPCSPTTYHVTFHRWCNWWENRDAAAWVAGVSGIAAQVMALTTSVHGALSLVDVAKQEQFLNWLQFLNPPEPYASFLKKVKIDLLDVFTKSCKNWIFWTLGWNSTKQKSLAARGVKETVTRSFWTTTSTTWTRTSMTSTSMTSTSKTTTSNTWTTRTPAIMATWELESRRLEVEEYMDTGATLENLDEQLEDHLNLILAFCFVQEHYPDTVPALLKVNISKWKLTAKMLNHHLDIKINGNDKECDCEDFTWVIKDPAEALIYNTSFFFPKSLSVFNDHCNSKTCTMEEADWGNISSTLQQCCELSEVQVALAHMISRRMEKDDDFSADFLSYMMMLHILILVISLVVLLRRLSPKSFLKNIVSAVPKFSVFIINYAWMNYLLCVAQTWWTEMPATVFVMGHPHVIPGWLLQVLCVWLLLFPAFFLVYIAYQIESAVTKKMDFDAGAGWVDKENLALAVEYNFGPLPICCAHDCIPIKVTQIAEYVLDSEADAGQEFREHEVRPNVEPKAF
eukprot:s2453_g18.t2